MRYVTLGTTSIHVEVADTQALREQGLSGRASLADGSGMLFVLDGESINGVWMKEMKFPIDVIWANTEGIVVTILPDISPDTYPHIFYPSKPAYYILEVTAGYVKAHGVAEGSKLVVQ